MAYPFRPFNKMKPRSRKKRVLETNRNAGNKTHRTSNSSENPSETNNERKNLLPKVNYREKVCFCRDFDRTIPPS